MARVEPGGTRHHDEVLVVGEALVDVVVDDGGCEVEIPGGSAANVAVALARLGRPVRFATALGADARGRRIADHLAAAGVGLAGDPYVLERTSVARARIGPDGSASYEFDLAWRLGDVEAGAPRFCHVTSLGAVLAPGADQVVALLAALPDATTIQYDVNARPAATGTGPEVVAAVERVARLADLVKASDEDLAALWPDLTQPEAVRHLLELGPRAVLLTRGGEGADWIAATERAHADAPAVQVVDTIGAGDTFAAATIDALWDDLDRPRGEVLARAVAAAAVTVSRPGADPPTRAELGG